MRIRFSSRVRLSAVLVLIALTPFAWNAVRRIPTYHAVPAGLQHAEDAVPAPPDDEQDAPSAVNFVSAEHMNRGYCHAGSSLDDPNAIGGYGKPQNAPRKVGSRSNGRGLYILAQPTVVSPYAGSSGMRVTLVNQTDDLLAFAACDSRLAIVQEAQAANGIWKPVDELPKTHCGNSYHRVFLPPNRFWAFPAPRYAGTIPTKLRFSMQLADGSRLHSNVFDGSINQGQFTAARTDDITAKSDPG
jgi:hypothetical protein